MVSSCVKSFSESFTSMDFCSSLQTARLSSSLIKPQLLTSSLIFSSITTNFASKKCKPHRVLKVSAGSFSYHKFIHFALNETKRHALLVPSPLQVLLHFLACCVYGFHCLEAEMGCLLNWALLLGFLFLNPQFWVSEGWKWSWVLAFELYKSFSQLFWSVTWELRWLIHRNVSVICHSLGHLILQSLC
jgi:hypothetical protein